MADEKTIYLNASPDCPGHVCFRTQENKRIDSFSGPRVPMIRSYLSAGYDVRDEDGKPLRIIERREDMPCKWYAAQREDWGLQLWGTDGAVYIVAGG